MLTSQQTALRGADILEMSVVGIADVQETYRWGQKYVYSTLLQLQKTHPHHAKGIVKCTSHGIFICCLLDVTLVVQLMGVVVLRMQYVYVCLFYIVLLSLAQAFACYIHV